MQRKTDKQNTIREQLKQKYAHQEDVRNDAELVNDIVSSAKSMTMFEQEAVRTEKHSAPTRIVELTVHE